ncbi:uncharacterized protein BKA78DRAFT_302127, partial [Phyllosticta capitalensis]|uniref:uncharacterized protein n=1 Tax=Phyllosticta capitalensis TaxID=121624 RepID=UPI003131DF54
MIAEIIFSSVFQRIRGTHAQCRLTQPSDRRTRSGLAQDEESRPARSMRGIGPEAGKRASGPGGETPSWLF